jgi:alpha-amylase
VSAAQDPDADDDGLPPFELAAARPVRRAPAGPAPAPPPPRAERTRDVAFYFQVHQPFRLRHFTFFDIGSGADWFDDAENERILRRVAERCYLPMNALLLRHIQELPGQFRCAFSLSGTLLEQLERWSPQALDSFVRLARTGAVEFLCETSHHSLASQVDTQEFARQVQSHARRIEELFGRRPTTFRNTELVISDDVARAVEDLGFTALLGEGADHLLGWRSPRYVYRPARAERLKLLLRDYVLSDDIAFRFSNREWPEWPLSPERFAAKLAAGPAQERFVGLFMDYETFGEHQGPQTGILDFMAALPRAVLADPRLSFATPAQIAERNEPVGALDVPRAVSWADAERDLTAWLGNPMQAAAHEALYALGRRLADRADAAGDLEGLAALWRKLTTSDHVYYMCTKFFSDGDVHKYFSPYASPHDAFISFMNVLDDLERRLDTPARPEPAPIDTPQPEENRTP